MPTTLKLPMTPVAAVLAVFAVVELFLREGPVAYAPLLATYALVLGTLVLLPRTPILVLALVLAEIFVVRETGFVDRVGTAVGGLATVAATFGAAALVPTRRLWLVGLIVAAHLVWRETLAPFSLVFVYADAALVVTGLIVGAQLQRRHQRLANVLAERDRLVAALATGPGDAATAEQLRMWSLLEQRIEPVVEQLPELVVSARAAAQPAERLETIRRHAADALVQMQETIHGLGDPAPPAPLEPADTRRRRTVPALWITVGLLLVAAVLEMAAAHAVNGYVLVFALLPLLAPRAPVLASLLLGIVVTVCSLDGQIPIAARLADFSALVILVVAGATARPARAGASVVVICVGMLGSQLLDPTTDWPAEAVIGSGLLYVGHWLFGVLLRDVAAEQRQVGASLAEAADALRALQERAVRRERVRVAHELHDLVGHALTAVAIQAGVAQAQLKHGRVPALDALEEAARQGVVELQRLATVLGHEADLTAELERVTDTARATGQHVELELELEPPATELAPQLRHTVVCVAAEALTNAAKHAGGAAVRVSLNARADRLELAVVDSGGHAHDLPSGGRGLDSMAQRVRACGGTFASGPRPGGGWTVQAVLPLSA